MTKFNSEEKVDSSRITASPPMDFGITYNLPPDEHLGHSMADNEIAFCHDCAQACYRKKRGLGSCRRSVCRCSISKIGD